MRVRAARPHGRWSSVLALALAAPGLLWGAPARAQHADAPGVGDVPAGPAAIRGHVVHGEDPAQAAGVELMLYALPAGALPGVRRATSGPDGAFAFEGISNDPQTAYLIGARHHGVPYPGARVSFEGGQTEVDGVEVRIGDVTADPSAVSVSELELRVGPRGGRLGVLELYRFENHGRSTVYLPPDARATGRPALRVELPGGADEFRVPLGLSPEGLVRDGSEVRFYGPVYPSAWQGPASQDQGISFEYSLPGDARGAVALHRRLPSGAGRVVLLVPADAAPPHVPGARADGELEIEGRPWRRFVYGAVKPGGQLAMGFTVPAVRVDPDALRLEEARVFLELDDAALRVQEQLRLTVRGDAPIVGRPGQPLLALHVPEGAIDLRFDRALFERGLRASDEGDAILDGPLPPGESTIEIAYQLPVADADAGTVFARRFDRKLPLLSIYVADTGLHFASERLHRRRPVATSDRTYLHLEAFEVEPAETVSLSLARMRAPAGLPLAFRYGLVALAAAAAVALLTGPIRRERSPGRLDEPSEDAARHEREAVYAALRDLEHDHETAKVSDADYTTMRQDLRVRAAALLRAEPDRPVRGAPPPRPGPPASPTCAACGAVARDGDRFCGRCGVPLAPGSPREASA